MKKVILYFMFLTVVFFSATAQRTVSGNVTDDSGESLPGVNVVIKGTTTGTTTDLDGNYRLSVDDDDALIFSFVGFETYETNVGARSIIDVAMGGITELEEVVVTAQGIERNKEALGFAVSTLGQEAVADKTEGDLVRSLRSKASGVSITQQNGLSGSGSNIIIRGYQSITGNNQPLFIVDGVPFNTNTNIGSGNDADQNNAFFDGGNSGSSRFLDLDPNNIEEVSILKGLAASTLYGSQGRNGVVLITTKSGSSGSGNKKMEISVSQSLFANQIASLPDYQNSYGNGFDQVFGWFYSNWGPSFDKDGLAGYANDNTISEDGFLPHPYSQWSNPALREAFPEFQRSKDDPDAVNTEGASRPGAPYAWRPYDNVRDFFRTGLVATTSINARGTSDDGKSSFNLNFGYLDDKGFTPGNELNRTSFSVGGRTSLSNGLNINGTMNLARTDFISPPISASEGNGSFNPRPGGVPVSSSVFGHVFFTPRSIDLMNLPFQNPIDGSSVYYRGGNDIQNPRWTIANAFNGQITNRVFGTIGASYDINDNINLAYRLGYDLYTESNSSGQNRGGVEGPLTGQYRTFDNVNAIWDHTISLNGNYDLSSQIGLSFNLGSQLRRNTLDRQGVTSTNQLVFGTFRHFNFTDQAPIQFSAQQNLVGLFGQAEIDWNGYAFLTLAGRNDAVSNFAGDNRSLFYPSISASVILTDLFPEITSPNLINFIKLRSGYGTSAGFREGFPTVTVVNAQPRKFVNSSGNIVSANTSGNLLGNPNLKPERQQEFEIGLEGRGWNNRVNIDLSWYRRSSRDLIFNRPLDPSTGYLSTFTNVGQVITKGLELDLGVDVFQNAAVTWNLRANFTRYRSEVTDLGNDTDQIAIAGVASTGLSNLGNYAVQGQPLGIMLGSRIKRNENGDKLINNAGSYEEEEGTFVIGDPTPDYVLNFISNVSYKGFTLSAVVNYQQGGDIYSRTVSTLLGRGLTTDTEDRKQTFILDGAVEDPNEKGRYIPNTFQVNNSRFWFSNVLFGPDELGVFDATTIRLQEVSLSYALPGNWLTNTPFGSVTIIASGFNLWYTTPNIPKGTNFDPNIAGLGVGNGQGFDYLNGPSSKRYGGTVKFTF